MLHSARSRPEAEVLFINMAPLGGPVYAARPADLPIPRQRGCSCSWGALPKFGAGGQFHLEGRALTQGRFDPNATAVHLHDLLGYGETQTSATLGFGVGAV